MEIKPCKICHGNASAFHYKSYWIAQCQTFRCEAKEVCLDDETFTKKDVVDLWNEMQEANDE